MSASTILAAIAPQFDNSAYRADHLELATLRVSVGWFGAKYDFAVALVAAHMLSLNTSSDRQNGETGTIASKKEGDLSISFSSGGMSDAMGDYDQTHYGKQFINLRKSCGIAMSITGGALGGI
jgi:hypothetical protein